MIKFFVPVLAILFVSCSSTYPNQKINGLNFPNVSGKSLTDSTYSIPSDMKGEPVLFLIGYKQNSQFDIDRWLIGLDMKNQKMPTYELPTIQGMFPKMFSTKIDQGMRKGIPKTLWKSVITIYDDGEKIQQFTGNQNPNNTRVTLLNAKGVIIYFNDQGFSVEGLNELIEAYHSSK